MTSEEYRKLREQGKGPIHVTAPDLLRNYWAELRVRVERNEITTKQAVELMNKKELQYYAPTAALDEIQAFRRRLAELVDADVITLTQAELGEARYRRWVLELQATRGRATGLTGGEHEEFWMSFIEGESPPKRQTR